MIADMGVGAKRIPPWLMPDSCLERADIDPAGRNRLRPDIMHGDVTVRVQEIYKEQPETPGTLDNHEQPEQGPWLVRVSMQKIRLIEGGCPLSPGKAGREANLAQKAGRCSGTEEI